MCLGTRSRRASWPFGRQFLTYLEKGKTCRWQTRYHTLHRDCMWSPGAQLPALSPQLHTLSSQVNPGKLYNASGLWSLFLHNEDNTEKGLRPRLVMGTVYVCKPEPRTWRVFYRCSECDAQHRYASGIFRQVSWLGSITLYSLLGMFPTPCESWKVSHGQVDSCRGGIWCCFVLTATIVVLTLAPLTVLERGKKFKFPSSTQTSWLSHSGRESSNLL